MDKTEFRVLIKHCFLMGKNTVQAQQWLEKYYPGSAPSKTIICRWYADFKHGRTDTNDAERSGRTNEAGTPENIKTTLKIVVDNRKCLFCIITILHQHLGMKKLSSKWVPRFLTMEQKQQRIDGSERCLALFTRNKKEFLRRCVIMDETSIHHYTPESKW
ncbi:histone-lysine N-methyltransferase SETMAR-like [Calliopsis andreniformis]|uniref:histone-lysine N-methyltransferase SETMAR-like n=1 Tax=Calliopsis andreniformis TaxID=337506 RepID=UPI003FCEBC7E